MRDRRSSDRNVVLLAYLIVLGMAVQLGVIGYVFWTGYQGRQTTVENQRAGCVRGKLDRVDNAAFQTAQRDYILKVTGAASVKEDVKEAAREAIETFDKTVSSITKRSLINCKEAFPDAKVIP